MNVGIDPNLFVRLMALSSGARLDLLEFFGQTPVDAQFLLSKMDAAGTGNTKPNPACSRDI